MFKKFLTKASPTAPTVTTGLHTPYAAPATNYLYNLLFCDDPSLFRNEQTASSATPWSTLLAEHPDPAALEAIANSEAEESRLRALACNRLRAAGHPVPAKQLLGVIVEVPLQQGLDVLAAYPDGRVRYLNQSGKIAIFEGGPTVVETLAREVVASAQLLVDKIGPWEKQRLPPPGPGKVRLSFLVSDGLYFGEGPYRDLQQDPLGGPVLAKATQLLQLVVKTGTSQKAQ